MSAVRPEDPSHSTELRETGLLAIVIHLLAWEWWNTTRARHRNDEPLGMNWNDERSFRGEILGLSPKIIEQASGCPAPAVLLHAIPNWCGSLAAKLEPSRVCALLRAGGGPTSLTDDVYNRLTRNAVIQVGLQVNRAMIFCNISRAHWLPRAGRPACVQRTRPSSP